MDTAQYTFPQVFWESPSDPPDEEWRPVVAAKGEIEVSNFGRVRYAPGSSWPRGRPLRFGTHNGYPYVRLYRGGHSTKTIPIHQLVMEAFVGAPPEGFEVNHRNADKTDNRLINLEYVTSPENIRHSKLRRLGFDVTTGRGLVAVYEQAAPRPPRKPRPLVSQLPASAKVSRLKWTARVALRAALLLLERKTLVDRLGGSSNGDRLILELPWDSIADS